MFFRLSFFRVVDFLFDIFLVFFRVFFLILTVFDSFVLTFFPTFLRLFFLFITIFFFFKVYFFELWSMFDLFLTFRHFL